MKKADLTVVEGFQKFDLVIRRVVLPSEQLKAPKPVAGTLTGDVPWPEEVFQPCDESFEYCCGSGLKPRPVFIWATSKDCFALGATEPFQFDLKSIKDSRDKAVAPNFFSSTVAGGSIPLEAPAKFK